VILTGEVNLADGQLPQRCEIVKSMGDRVTIDRRFRGPAGSGNGGYSCGVLAGFVDPRAAQVTLRLPPPLDRPLDVEPGEDGTATLRDDEALVAEAQPIDELELEIPAPIGVEEAAAARAASPMQHHHPFPECFVCGPNRRPGDGLRVTCGPVGDDMVASPWEVDETVSSDGEVPPEIVWSVLDCPGGISGMLLPDLGQSVLGRLAARIYGRIEPGMTCVAIGWPIGREGRKLDAGSAILSEDGEVLAHARATWIELKR
jgi:hypothetical protein